MWYKYEYIFPKLTNLAILRKRSYYDFWRTIALAIISKRLVYELRALYFTNI